MMSLGESLLDISSEHTLTWHH